MKTIIVISAGWLTVSLLSCQKQLHLPGGPLTDSGIVADTTPVFAVTDIWRYDYDPAGNIIADSEHTSFSYDTVALSTTITGEYRDAVNGNFNYKHVFFYDKNHNWLKDEEYDPSNFALLKYSNIFYRNAAGDAQRFEYIKDDYSGNPRYFTAFFQYRSLGNGNREITVVDTFFRDYTLHSYYRVEQDVAGKPVVRELLPWSQNAGSKKEFYFYDAAGQVQKVIDSSVYNNPPDPALVSVTVLNYTQDPAAANTLDHFTKELSGRNFWWYLQGKNYVYHLLYDAYYVGRPLKAINSKEEIFQNGVLQSTTQTSYTFNNSFDQDKNLSESLYLANNKKTHRYKFAYKKIR